MTKPMTQKPNQTIATKGEASRKFVQAVRQILSVPKEELAKREAAYQQERAVKKIARKSKLSALLILPFLLLSIGCATSPVRVADSRPVPPERRLSGFDGLATQAADSVKVVVIRDTGSLGSVAKAKLLVDGAPVATFWMSERLVFFVTPGEHIFGVSCSPQLSSAIVESSFMFTAGQTRYFRISISDTSFKVQPTTQIQ